jgi:hypothetical protein
MQQFLHHWLPTNAHKARKQDISKPSACPFGCDEDETNLHFLHCPKDAILWTETISTLISSRSTQVPVLGKLLQTAITSQNITRDLHEPPDDAPITTYTLFQLQANIGWDQIIYGRWSKQWIQTYDITTKSDRGLQWASALLLDIWKALIHKWKRRCTTAHLDSPTNVETATTAINSQIDTMYETIDKLDSVDKKLLSRPIEDVKKLPLKQKKAWVRRTQPHLQTGLHRARIRQTLCTRPITHYFTPQNHLRDQQRPLHQNPRLLSSPKARRHDFDPP